MQLEDIRNFIKKIKASVLKLDRLAAIQRHLNVRKLVPILDVETRWSCVFYMLSRFVEIHRVLVILVATGDFDDIERLEFLSPSELLRFKDIVKVLAVPERFIRALEGEKYLTMPLVPSQLNKVSLLSLSPSLSLLLSLSLSLNFHYFYSVSAVP